MEPFTIDKDTGLLTGADKFILSPNHNERPENTEIDLLVIHGISLPPAEFGGPYIEALFTNTLDPRCHPYFQQIADLRVSAHVLIRRRGEIIQFVPLNKRAWHAGVSEFQGRNNCNDFSIGIELEGTDTQAYEEIQYQQLARLARVICQTYPAITCDHIVGHSEIAPGRKTDPGQAFNWSYFHHLISV